MDNSSTPRSFTSEASMAYREQSFLKTLLRNLPDMVWMKDKDGVYLACNARFEEFFGARETDIVGKTDYDFVDKPLADFFRWHDLKAMNTNQPSVNEEWITLSDGRKIRLETTKTAIPDDQGQILGVLGIGHDITHRTLAEAAVRESSERYKAILASTLDGFWLVDLNGTLQEVNTAYCQQSGFSRAELIGKSLLELDPYEKPEVIPLRNEKIRRQGGDVFETWHRRKDGSEWPVEVSISYSELNGGCFFVFLRDISERKANEQQIQYMAYNDVLTGLPNRLLLEDRLRHEIAHHQRSGKRIAVLFLDLDGFKRINDRHGHDIGDQLLITIANRMKHVFRISDTVARLGGDEFVAILPGLDIHSDRLPILNRLLAVIAESMQIGEHNLKVSASIGVTFYPQAEDVDAEQLLRQADQAMYQAKLAGKNRFHIFDTHLDRTLRHRHQTLSKLREARENGELELYYQPKVDMRNGEVIGAEALLRWHHPQRGLLTPNHFLPGVEGLTFLIELGEWTLHQAMQCLRGWQQQGLGLTVSVNLAGLHLQQDNFMERLLQILAHYPDVPTQLLELEVLETSALENVAHVSSVISECRKLGIRFALDDFGTGYSSLTYLKLLPTQILKIDRSFVSEMLDDPENLSLLDGVIKLAHSFQRDIIAEGVETIEQGETLLQLGCYKGQGFAIATPMPASHIPGWIATRQPELRWLNREPLESDMRMLLYATSAHHAWRREIEDYLADRNGICRVEAAQCRFNQFLESCTSLDDSERQPLIEQHRQVHLIGQQIIESCQQEQLDLPPAWLHLLNQHSQQLAATIKCLLLTDQG